MSNGMIPFKVITIKGNKSLLVLIYDDLTWANRKYQDFKESLTVKIAEMADREFLVEFNFTDVPVTHASYILSVETLELSGLGLLTYTEQHNWSCGYYEIHELKYINPVKPLSVEL